MTYSSKYRLLFLGLIALVVACQPKERPAGLEVGLRPLPPSAVHMNIVLPVETLGEGINGALSKQLVNEGIQLNRKGDSLFLKVSKAGPLQINFVNQQLVIYAPIRVSAVIEKKVLGMVLTNQDQPVVFTATAKLSSPISLAENWDLNFDFSWDQLIWKDPPVFDLLGFRWDLTDIIEEQIEQVKPMLTNKINALINKKIDLSHSFADVYNKVQQPIRLSVNPPLFLHMEIESLKGTINPYLTDTLTLSTLTNTSFTISSKPRQSGQYRLPKRIPVQDWANGLDIYAQVLLSIDQIEQIAKKELIDKTFEYEGATVTISSLDVYHKEGYLYCEIGFTGDRIGRVRLYGIPDFKEDYTFSLAAFGFELVDGDELLKLTDATLHDALEGILRESFAYNLENQWRTLGTLINQKIESLPVGDKIDLNVSFEELKLENRGITDESIQLIFSIKGEANILLESGIFNQ